MYIHEQNPYLHAIPAPGSSHYGQDYLNEVTVGAILGGAVNQGYDVILIDMPGNMRATPLTGALASWPQTLFYLLYTPGYTFGLEGFARAAQIVSGLSARERARIVVLEHDQSPYARTEIEREWTFPVVGVLPFDPLVEESQRLGLSVRGYLEQKGGLARLGLGLSGQGGYAAAALKLADQIVAEAEGAI